MGGDSLHHQGSHGPRGSAAVRLPGRAVHTRSRLGCRAAGGGRLPGGAPQPGHRQKGGGSPGASVAVQELGRVPRPRSRSRTTSDPLPIVAALQTVADLVAKHPADFSRPSPRRWTITSPSAASARPTSATTAPRCMPWPSSTRSGSSARAGGTRSTLPGQPCEDGRRRPAAVGVGPGGLRRGPGPRRRADRPAVPPRG